MLSGYKSFEQTWRILHDQRVCDGYQQERELAKKAREDARMAQALSSWLRRRYTTLPASGSTTNSLTSGRIILTSANGHGQHTNESLLNYDNRRDQDRGGASILQARLTTTGGLKAQRLRLINIYDVE